MSEEKAGSATTDANVKGFAFQLQMQNPRPEYAGNAQRAGAKLAEALKNDPDLYRALSYLASDTPFMFVFASKDIKRIIIP